MVITTIQAGENPEWSHMHFRVVRVAQSTQKKNLKSKHTDPYVSIDLRKESNSANHVSVLFFLQTLKMAIWFWKGIFEPTEKISAWRAFRK